MPYATAAASATTKSISNPLCTQPSRVTNVREAPTANNVESVRTAATGKRASTGSGTR